MRWRTSDTEDGLAYEASVDLMGAAVERVEWVLDLDRGPLANSSVLCDGKEAARLGMLRPKGEEIHSGRYRKLELAGGLRISLTFSEPRQVSLQDRWDVKGEVIRTRMPLEEGGQTGTIYLAHSGRSYQIRVPVADRRSSQGLLRMTLRLEAPLTRGLFVLRCTPIASDTALTDSAETSVGTTGRETAQFRSTCWATCGRGGRGQR